MRYVVTAPAPTPDTTPAQPGLLYAVWRAEDRSRGWFRRVYLDDDGHTVDEVVHIGPGGVESVRQMVFGEDQLRDCLARLHADLVYAKTGERVGPYADPSLDLDALPPQAKRAVLDAFAADLEARREPRRLAHGTPAPESEADPAPAPVPAPEPPVDPELERNAFALGRDIWLGGGQHLHQLYRGRNGNARQEMDDWISYATAQQWVVGADEKLLPGTVKPIRKMALVEGSPGGSEASTVRIPGDRDPGWTTSETWHR
jgi:hypothetical protein